MLLNWHELLTSDPVPRELERILPKKLGQSEEVTQAFMNLLHTHALKSTTEHPSPSLPDPDDESIIACAIAGNANVFVTGTKRRVIGCQPEKYRRIGNRVHNGKKAHEHR